MTNANNLIERLRQYRSSADFGSVVEHAICTEAADVLERYASDRSYIIGCNDGFADAIEQAATLADESAKDFERQAGIANPPAIHDGLLIASDALELTADAIRTLAMPTTTEGSIMQNLCPICAEPLRPDDPCASDITEGTCHAACLEGSPVVDLDTGEELPDGKVHTYRYCEVMEAETAAGAMADVFSVHDGGNSITLHFAEIKSAKAFRDTFAPGIMSPAPASHVGVTLEEYFERQINWSRETFGPALRTGGVLDHIRKELREIEADPHDLSEWVDVVILAMDGFWRHGGKASDLLPALLGKQRKNMARTWPDWRTMSENSAIEHDRSHDVPTTEGSNDA